jgi:hypothetical protein
VRITAFAAPEKTRRVAAPFQVPRRLIRKSGASPADPQVRLIRKSD